MNTPDANIQLGAGIGWAMDRVMTSSPAANTVPGQHEPPEGAMRLETYRAVEAQRDHARAVLQRIADRHIPASDDRYACACDGMLYPCWTANTCREALA